MKRFLALFLTLSFFSPLSFVHAAGKAAKFELTVTQTAKVGEAIDLGVKVLGSDGAVVTDYAGTVYVTVDNDSKATLPYSEGYTFVASDQGNKTFSKGLAFSKAGSMTVSVIDIDDDKVEGVAKVNVSEGDAGSGVTASETVTITSPENGSTVSGTEVNLIGTAKKNSKFKVFLNGEEVGESQTDDKGEILYVLKGLDQQQNVVSIKIFDGTDKAVGESQKVSFSLAEDKGPEFKSLIVAEGKEVKSGAVLHVTVSAEPKLKEVSAALGDSVEVLKEGAAGTYEGTLTAPTASGSYPIDATLTNDLGKKTVKTAAETITVLETPKTAFQNIKVQASEAKATFTFEVVNETEQVSKFKFLYGSDSGSLTKEAITYDKEKIRQGSGTTYSWYVSGLEEPKKYFFRIVALDTAGSLVSGVESELVEADLSLNAAGKCTIANIAGVKVSSTEDQSILEWDTIPEALSYNVYRKDSSGSFVLVENVKANKYVIHLAKGDVKYEDFGVKAVCSDATTESANYAEVTKVQTGPAQIIALLSLALGIGYFLTRRKFAFFRG
jgi:hypothetical protein